MTKQLAVLVGVLLTLGAAFAQNVRTDSEKTMAAIQHEPADVSVLATVQVASLWIESGKANASTRLARPL